MTRIRDQADQAFYHGATERDNPYDRSTQPKEHAAWHDAHWDAWREYKRLHKDWFGDAGGES